jgi:RsiW-degrading membrane proteinase PrsW (M82 family)
MAAFSLLIVLIVLLPAVAARADPPLLETPQGLIETHTPVLYFHQDELFRPQRVDVLLQTARLRQTRGTLPDANVLSSVTATALEGYRDLSYYLDVWLGDNGSSDARNYSALRDRYVAGLSPDAGGPPIVAYAHVVADEVTGQITIQYWFFYFYNDWFNKHEGDWEMIQVMLDRSGQPQWAVYSQHQGGTRRRWQDTPVEGGTHPIVYVALGSHANYFSGNELYPHGRVVGNSQVTVLDRTGLAGMVTPEVVMLPDRRSGVQNGPLPAELTWMDFGGRWGEKTAIAGFEGPTGPCFKGDQWERPFDWGMSQPLDLGTWYGNRLQIAVTGAVAQVDLVSSQTPNTTAVETLPDRTILHRDPRSGEVFTANIAAPPDTRFDLAVNIPSPQDGMVARYVFRTVALAEVGRASLAMRAGETPVLFVEGSSPRWPDTFDASDALWDAPDLAWMAQSMPTWDLLKGLALSFVLAVVPAYFYLTVLYYADRYEKEPLRLVLTAFFWGAWPAFAIGLLVVLIFRLPVELWGRDAVEAVRMGLLSPVIEELVKGAVLVFIMFRFRREIDSVHDGIIYGAAVGLGFAMTANMLSYMGGFLTHGFVELQRKVFVEGFIYGLNHAFYTALFGAGLAYAVLAPSRTRRWAVPTAALLFAVIANGLHGVLMRNTLGVNLLSYGLTWLGALIVLAIMFWSLKQQQRTIQRELVGEVPDSLRLTLLRPGARAWAEAMALRQRGWRGWRQTRDLFQLSAELAFRKAQYASHPDQTELALDVDTLRSQVQRLMESAIPGTS